MSVLAFIRDLVAILAGLSVALVWIAAHYDPKRGGKP